MSDRVVHGNQIPQTNSLDKVRRVVAAVAGGATATRYVAEQTKITPRHVAYAIGSARALGWLTDEKNFALSPAGHEMLVIPPGSAEERALRQEAITNSYVIRAVAPDLLAEQGPTLDELVRRVMALAPGLSLQTARRRAQTLLNWRAQVRGTGAAGGNGVDSKEVAGATEVVVLERLGLTAADDGDGDDAQEQLAAASEVSAPAMTPSTPPPPPMEELAQEAR